MNPAKVANIPRATHVSNKEANGLRQMHQIKKTIVSRMHKRKLEIRSATSYTSMQS